VEEINLYQLLRYYLKQWKWIMLASIAGLIIGTIYTFILQTPLYKSSATLLVIQPSVTTGTSDTTMSNYVELLTSRRVLDPVIEAQHINMPYEQFVDSVSASSGKNTDIINISVVSQDAKTSKEAASNTILSFKKEIERIYDKDNVQVVDDANVPDRPYNVNILIQLTLATVAGFVLAILGFFFTYDFKHSWLKTDVALDTSISSTEPESKTGTKKARQERATDRRNTREAKRLIRKRATARRKAVAKKARQKRVAEKKAAKALEREKRVKLTVERKATEKKMHDEYLAKRRIARESKRADSFALIPLRKWGDEIKTARNLRHKIRQAERETVKAGGLEKRAAAIARSQEATQSIKAKTKPTNKGQATSSVASKSKKQTLHAKKRNGHLKQSST
jgi:capsular polysaccharide biosynthesis protein